MDWVWKELTDKNGVLLAKFHNGKLAEEICRNPGNVVYKNRRMKTWGNAPKNMRKAKGMVGVITAEGIQIYGMTTVNLAPVPNKRTQGDAT